MSEVLILYPGDSVVNALYFEQLLDGPNGQRLVDSWLVLFKFEDGRDGYVAFSTGQLDGKTGSMAYDEHGYCGNYCAQLVENDGALVIEVMPFEIVFDS